MDEWNKKTQDCIVIQIIKKQKEGERRGKERGERRRRREGERLDY